MVSIMLGSAGVFYWSCSSQSPPSHLTVHVSSACVYLLLQAFNYQLWRQAQYLSPSDIGALLYSMAYIQATPSKAQLKRMLDLMVARVDQAAGDDFANVLLALAQFNYTPL